MTDLIVMNLSKIQEIVEDRPAWHLQSMGLQRVGQDLATEQQQQQKILSQKRNGICSTPVPASWSMCWVGQKFRSGFPLHLTEKPEQSF